MRRRRAGWVRGAAAAVGLAAIGCAPAFAQPAPATRVALVIGDGAYRAGPLPAAPDDAGLVAQVLAGAGFAVTGARDLDGDGLRRVFRDFLDRAGAAGPDGIAVVYFAGRAVQSDGDDFLVPVDARLARPADVPIEALRLADFTHALAALPIQARVVIVDGAYPGAPPSSAPGLALMDAEQGELLAFNAAPGTAAPATAGPYGAYAQALAAAVKQGGVPVEEVFDRVRLMVNQSTGGAVVPWHADKLTRSFAFFDRAPDAPAMASAQVPFAALDKRPLAGFPPAQAYDVALARDTLPAYVEFLAAFPTDPLARRVRPILAVRREALFWHDAIGGNTPGAYWTYLSRYPKGPHAGDARRRLARLAAGASPPPRFVPLTFDVPPPGPDEAAFDHVVFDAPDLPRLPPPPVSLLPPLVDVAVQRPPPPPGPAFLPVPIPASVPGVRPLIEPGAIVPPRGVDGAYPRSRPYVRGPNGDGLVAQAAPSPAPPTPDVRQRPAGGAPSPALTPIPPAPGGPVPPGQAAPTAVSPIAPPTSPRPPSPVAPRGPTPPSPPDFPTAPTAPARPSSAPKTPAAAVPAPLPPRPAEASAAVPEPQPGAPAAMPPRPAPATVRPPGPGTLHPHSPAVLPGSATRTPPAARPDSSPPAQEPLPAAPHPVPRRAPNLPRPAPASSSAPAQQRAPRPEHPTAAPPAPVHAPAEHRPACGHPGEPPCRP